MTRIELIKRRYRREFRQALYEAFAELSSEQRYQLRLHFIEKLSTTEMGAMFYVNQSTVSRWLKNARRAVHEGTKRRLQERLGLSSNEFTSLLNAIESQLELSVSQVFKEPE
jgi:RNA polymerase sigma-70 factor, ECF subfamily